MVEEINSLGYQYKYYISIVDGTRCGVYKEWFRNGKIRTMLNYKGDKLDGQCQFWYVNGKLGWISNYKNGKLVYMTDYKTGRMLDFRINKLSVVNQ